LSLSSAGCGKNVLAKGLVKLSENYNIDLMGPIQLFTTSYFQRRTRCSNLDRFCTVGTKKSSYKQLWLRLANLDRFLDGDGPI
jgi:hypothetical protein